MCGSDIFLGVIAIFFPPIAVWVKRGLCSADSLINLCLCMLGFLPGLFHAWYIIASSPDPTYEEVQDPERNGGNGQVTYYYVQQGQPQHPGAGPRKAPAKRQQQGYGTVSSSTPNAQFPGGQQSGFVQPQAGASSSGGEEVPPTYQQAVGDHKVQGP